MTKKRKGHEPEYSRHHKIADSRGGSIEAPNNERTVHETHKAIHKLFGNEYTLEKIQTIVTMDEAILTDFFKRAIMDVLNLNWKDVVIREAFKNNASYKNFPNTRAHA